MSPRLRRKFSRFLVRAKPLFFVLGMFCLLGLVVFIRPKSKPSFWWTVLFANPLKQSDGLTNILLLGVPGGTHEGADLTDTMILLSLNRKNSKTVLVSLPRDIWSQTLAAKINSAYHYGEEKKPGGGLILTKSIIEELTGLPIHYAVKIDFAGFEKMTDLLGGVEIEVERTFDDYKYPIEGKENDLCGGDPEYKCRYQHLHFEAGHQLFNGEKALQYVRSRNAEGEEGTDFARSQRQQKLILALKNRIFSSEFLFGENLWLLKPKKAFQLIEILGRIVETDIPQDSLPYFGKMIIKIDSSKIRILSLEEFLINPPIWQYGQWVLIPRTGDFSEVQEYLKEQVLK